MIEMRTRSFLSQCNCWYMEESPKLYPIGSTPPNEILPFALSTSQVLDKDATFGLSNPLKAKHLNGTTGSFKVPTIDLYITANILNCKHDQNKGRGSSVEQYFLNCVHKEKKSQELLTCQVAAQEERVNSIILGVSVI